MTAELSVLMATYWGDEPGALRHAIESVWATQTFRPREVILVVDGPVGPESNAIIAEAEQSMGCSLKITRLSKNSGLATALNAGLSQCSGELVARMDADDVSAPVRFEKQLAFMRDHPEVSVVGTWATERDTRTGETTCRFVPTTHEEIERFAKRRNPISHPSVMFRKQSVLSAGGYPVFRQWEDYALWSVLLLKGLKFANLGEVLLEMNGGTSLMRRRGLRYYLAESEVLAFQHRIGFLSTPRFLANLVGRFIVRAAPVRVRALVYRRLRR